MTASSSSPCAPPVSFAGHRVPRKPLVKNRAYFAAANDAIAAGYRPCKRCRPLDTDGRPPAWVARLLDAVEREPQTRRSDADLRRAGIDPIRARRYFQKHYGMTFQAYCRRRRMGEALRQIQRGAKLDDVALGNGYESHSGFREAFTRLFGLPPGQGRTAGCVVVAWTESPVGPLLLGANDEGVCLLEFTDRQALERQIAALRRHFACAIVPGTHPHLEQLQRELSAYFAGTLRQFTAPLVYPGTAFQRQVWGQLRQIPYGETQSYEDIARAVGAHGPSAPWGRPTAATASRS